MKHSTKFFDVFDVSRGTYTAQFLEIVDNSSKMWDFLPDFTKNGKKYVDNLAKFFSKNLNNSLTELNLCNYCG